MTISRKKNIINSFTEICNKYKKEGTTTEFYSEVQRYLLNIGLPGIKRVTDKLDEIYVSYHNKGFGNAEGINFINEVEKVGRDNLEKILNP